ncbi:polysaccharide pyruvyl transferase family protein [Leeuwenhoekiella aestuarii]|uniref:Polysaccharide pyruvyl transferase n=1 Tax=Leeuwenhoekiella aestuarii TaxID=2249426 RepID=A0A4Q0NSB3_9FLAO|nr:polysaccharide pyruvyl transferase family protein [Leeuwenhoekiella aestuarii]RXG13095.1 polysaccharide pyruvyl transferase [Leeuwenhoekiella aestuarii]
MKKKIGVATLGNAKENYGQILQAYALQAFLKKNGYDPFLIRYRRKITLEDEKGLRKFAKRIYLLLKGDNTDRKIKNPDAEIEVHLSLKQKDFQDFYNNLFNQTDLFYHGIKELRENPPQADVYIAGSDQIWNWGGRYGYDPAYFLQFGSKNIKRIVYAAGMSKISSSAAAKNELKEYMKNLDRVALREPTGIPILKEAGCKDPQVVLDPSLLLDNEDYDALTNSVEPIKENYVLGYFINFESPESINWGNIENYLESEDITFKYVSSEGYYDPIHKLGKYENQHFTIAEWISAYQNATYVVTSSYHGLLFSIFNKKPFLFFFVQNSKHKYGENRAKYILGELGLETRLYDRNSSKSFKEQLEAPIDWNNVEKKYKALKDKSIKFLLDAIEGV